MAAISLAVDLLADDPQDDAEKVVLVEVALQRMDSLATASVRCSPRNSPEVRRRRGLTGFLGAHSLLTLAVQSPCVLYWRRSRWPGS